MAEKKRVSVEDAAAEIGCAAEFLRRQMKAGNWDLGAVVKPRAGQQNYTYYVFRDKLNMFLGITA